jgi:hypothetical protein
VDWLDACIALRVVGAVLVVVLRRWRKICKILQPMGSKDLNLKKCLKTLLTNKKQRNLDYTPTTLLSQRKVELTARNTLFAL